MDSHKIDPPSVGSNSSELGLKPQPMNNNNNDNHEKSTTTTPLSPSSSQPPSSSLTVTTTAPATATATTTTHGSAFWLVIASLCLIGFTASLDGSIIAIALPQISTNLNLGDQYIHAGNCFVFAQTVVQPGIAQLCDIFGRRWPLIISVAIFAIGSGIAGGANSVAILIFLQARIQTKQG